MSLKSENDLSPSIRNQVKRARQAEQSKNYDYSIALMQNVLKDEPLYLEGRQFLRAVEIQKYQALGTFSKQMLSVKVATAAMKLSTLGKKEPGEQMVLAEEVLALDPYQPKANSVIAEAGAALGYPEFKAFAYETLSDDGNSNNKTAMKAILNNLAQAYMEMKDGTKAEKTFDRILDLDPKDGDALSGRKNAQALHATRSGGWETSGGDYRKVIKNIEEAEQLETEAKAVKSLDVIDEQIQLNFKKHQDEPTNPVHSKVIARLFLQKNDYANAIAFFQHSYEQGGKIDSSLEKNIGDLQIKLAEQELQTLRAELTQLTDPEAKAQKQAEIDQKLKDLNQVRLDLAEARVRAQPNEGEFRYDLGEALFMVGEYRRAGEELQKSLKQPSVRYKALNLMGLSFMQRGMLDLAIEKLSLAESELLDMDDLKKEIVYNLGLAYEKTKETEKSINQWKKIYGVDMSYRDVARRVEDSYGQGSGTA